MLTYRFGPVTVSVTLDDPAPMQTWLSHLLPPISALHGDDADAEIDSIKALAATILATPGRTYGETLHGAVLDLRYPDLFTTGARATTAGWPPTSPPEAEVYRYRDRQDS